MRSAATGSSDLTCTAGDAGSPAAEPPQRVLVVMGVSGSGKSTLARRLADELGWDLQEGDELHPAANLAKMSAGRPLSDADREPWLAAVRAWIDAQLDQRRSGVVSCSALRRSYRDWLRRPGVTFVYLDVGRPELARRLATRAEHFMPAQLLDSQLATLEVPTAAEADVIRVDGERGDAVTAVLARLD